MRTRIALLAAGAALASAALAAADPPLPRPTHCGAHTGYGTHRINDIYQRGTTCETALKVAESWLGTPGCDSVGYCRVHQHNWSCHNTFRRGETEHKATCGLIGGGYGTEVILYWERRRA